MEAIGDRASCTVRARPWSLRRCLLLPLGGHPGGEAGCGPQCRLATRAQLRGVQPRTRVSPPRAASTCAQREDVGSGSPRSSSNPSQGCPSRDSAPVTAGGSGVIGPRGCAALRSAPGGCPTSSVVQRSARLGSKDLRPGSPRPRPRWRPSARARLGDQDLAAWPTSALAATARLGSRRGATGRGRTSATFITSPPRSFQVRSVATRPVGRLLGTRWGRSSVEDAVQAFLVDHIANPDPVAGRDAVTRPVCATIRSTRYCVSSPSRSCASRRLRWEEPRGRRNHSFRRR